MFPSQRRRAPPQPRIAHKGPLVPGESQEILVYVDATGACRWASEPTWAAMGWPRDWIIGRDLREVIHPHHRHEPEHLTVGGLWAWHSHRPTPYRAANGGYRWMSVDVSPLPVPPRIAPGVLLRFRTPPPNVSTTDNRL